MIMATNNSNKRSDYALVTGGTSGIGYELAKLLASNGYNLILVARSNERLLEVADEFTQFEVDVIALDKDLFEANAAHEVYQQVKANGLHVSVLVNNAAQGQRGKFHEVPLERHLDLLQLNIVSLVSLTKLFLDDMVMRNNGKILNLASVVSKTPAPQFSVYAASKAFVLSFSEALAHELKETGVTITALLPGRTDTAFFEKADMEDSKEYQDHALADPEKVARDGFDAMMSGESRVISGIQNKLLVSMMNAMPDSANSANMQKNMKPSDKAPDERRQGPEHVASERERDTIGKEDAARQRGIESDELNKV
jgi:uncharacterized protein